MSEPILSVASAASGSAGAAQSATPAALFEASLAEARDQTDPEPEGSWLMRGLGVLQTAGGVGEMILGGAGVVAPEPVTSVVGAGVFLHGADTTAAGLQMIWTGQPVETLTERAATAAAESLGADPETASTIGAGVDFAAGLVTPSGVARAVTREGGERIAREIAEQAAEETSERALRETLEHADDLAPPPSAVDDAIPSKRIDGADGAGRPHADLPPARARALDDVYREAKERGVVILTDADPDIRLYMDDAARREGVAPDELYAVTLGDTILVRQSHATDVRTLREELIHTIQQADGLEIGSGMDHRTAMELDARRQLLENREAWALTNDEVAAIEREISIIEDRGRY